MKIICADNIVTVNKANISPCRMGKSNVTGDSNTLIFDLYTSRWCISAHDKMFDTLFS